jgi:hypothetical protein
MARRCNLAKVEGDGVASLCEVVCGLCESDVYARCSLCEFGSPSRRAPLVAL